MYARRISVCHCRYWSLESHCSCLFARRSDLEMLRVKLKTDEKNLDSIGDMCECWHLMTTLMLTKFVEHLLEVPSNNACRTMTNIATLYNTHTHTLTCLARFTFTRIKKNRTKRQCLIAFSIQSSSRRPDTCIWHRCECEPLMCY